jgi:membrane protein implicated in regulation of membrane protease activity
MDLSGATGWWIVAGGLVAIELATGTFYLLMLALGAAAAAVAAHLGVGGSGQVAAAALVGGGATALWHYKRASAPRSAPQDINPDVQIDLGQRVRVDAWQSDRSARVQYRGASWSVRYSGDGEPQPGDHVIVAVHGNHLSVAPAPRV